MSILTGLTAVAGAAAIVYAGKVVLKTLSHAHGAGTDVPFESSPSQESENTDAIEKNDTPETTIGDDLILAEVKEEEKRREEQKEKDDVDKKLQQQILKAQEEKKSKEQEEERKKKEKEEKEKEKEKDKEKQTEKSVEKEKSKETKENALNDLFDMDKKPVLTKPLQKSVSLKQQKTLGMQRPDMALLKSKTNVLTASVVSLTGKGLNPFQIAHNILNKEPQTPYDELIPLIDAVHMVSKQQTLHARDAARVGIDMKTQVQSALNSLAKGNPEVAFNLLEKARDEKTTAIKLAKHPKEKLDFMKEASELFRATAVLERPVDFEKSFRSLEQAQQFDPNNPITEALMARACYETGNVKTAQQMFKHLARQTDEKTAGFSLPFARQMLPKIATERAFEHARHIRKEYDDRLMNTEGRQKTSQRMAMQRALARSNEEEREFIRQ